MCRAPPAYVQRIGDHSASPACTTLSTGAIGAHAPLTRDELLVDALAQPLDVGRVDEKLAGQASAMPQIRPRPTHLQCSESMRRLSAQTVSTGAGTNASALTRRDLEIRQVLPAVHRDDPARVLLAAAGEVGERGTGAAQGMYASRVRRRYPGPPLHRRPVYASPSHLALNCCSAASGLSVLGLT